MDTFSPITVNRYSTKEEREFALRQIYGQVLERQPYFSERAQLNQLEKDFLKNKIGVRRFLKELGHSDIYLEAFYYPSSNPKFIENSFKHFLGRAVHDDEEMRHYINVLAKSGVLTLINTILDSEEYRKHFGCFTVPYPRSEERYESPNDYLETNVIRHEHCGQRGWSLPTLYWHQLGLDCDAGTCTPIGQIDQEPVVTHPEVVSTSADAEPVFARVSRSDPQTEAVHDELMELLWGMDG